MLLILLFVLAGVVVASEEPQLIAEAAPLATAPINVVERRVDKSAVNNEPQSKYKSAELEPVFPVVVEAEEKYVKTTVTPTKHPQPVPVETTVYYQPSSTAKPQYEHTSQAEVVTIKLPSHYPSTVEPVIYQPTTLTPDYPSPPPTTSAPHHNPPPSSGHPKPPPVSYSQPPKYRPPPPPAYHPPVPTTGRPPAQYSSPSVYPNQKPQYQWPRPQVWSQPKPTYKQPQVPAYQPPVHPPVYHSPPSTNPAPYHQSPTYTVSSNKPPGYHSAPSAPPVHYQALTHGSTHYSKPQPPPSYQQPAAYSKGSGYRFLVQPYKYPRLVEEFEVA